MKSGWADLNRRPPRPKRGALPTALHPESGCEYNACMLNRQEPTGMRHHLTSLFLVILLSILALTACSTAPKNITPTLQISTEILANTPTSVSTSVSSPSPTTLPTAAVVQKPTCATQAGRVESKALDTTLMYAQFLFNVYLPPCYAEELDRIYPLLILFHGIYNDQDQWLRIGAVETANRLIITGEVISFIIVMPYDPNPRGPQETPFDEIFLQELLPYLDANYRVASDPKLRAVGGVSRGAGWAIHFGFEHTELFGAIGAHSPIIFADDYPDLAKWLDALPQGMIPRISMDIGENDPNREGYEKLTAILTAKEIPFDASEFPGYHSDDYWRSRVESYLRWYASGW